MLKNCYSQTRQDLPLPSICHLLGFLDERKGGAEDHPDQSQSEKSVTP